MFRKLKLKAYLERIGYGGPLHPTAQVLARLHWRHLISVPFENLDIHLGRPIVLGEAAFYDKIVEHGRGGYCYELNGSFAALLKGIGFNVSMLSARVANEDGGFTPDFDHMALLVRMKDSWLVDVGFGDSFSQPKRFDNPRPQRENGRAYRVTDVSGGRLLSQWDEKNSWKPQYLFTLRHRKLEDFAPRNLYQQTSPDSHFRKGPVCTRLSSEGRLTLTDKKFIVTRASKRFERPLKNPTEFRTLLHSQFGIDLEGTQEAFTGTRLRISRRVPDSAGRAFTVSRSA